MLLKLPIDHHLTYILIVNHPHRLDLFYPFYASNKRVKLDMLLDKLYVDYHALPADELFNYFMQPNIGSHCLEKICKQFKLKIGMCSVALATRALNFFRPNRKIYPIIKRIFAHHRIALHQYIVHKKYQRPPIIKSTCCVCLEDTSTYTECNHHVCLDCVYQLRDTSNQCPLCRTTYEIVYEPVKADLFIID